MQPVSITTTRATGHPARSSLELVPVNKPGNELVPVAVPDRLELVSRPRRVWWSAVACFAGQAAVFAAAMTGQITPSTGIAALVTVAICGVLLIVAEHFSRVRNRLDTQ